MELPRTLHGQLFLLSYDSKRRRFLYGCDGSWKNEWRFEFALRSAMLTDLYLAGHIENRNGEAAVLVSRHHDPLLQTTLSRVGGRGWSELVQGGGRTSKDVYDQLETAGWISEQRHRLFGLAPATHTVYDVDMIDVLTRRVTDALRNILADRPADPPALAAGLIAVQARLPVMSPFIDYEPDRRLLHEMTLAAIEPILALYNAIHRRSERTGWGAGGGGGGCSGGGCSGGGGGCGGGGGG